MKKLIFLLVAGFVFLISCDKDEDAYAPATILGYDLRLCACCGGLLVDFGDDNTSDTYQWHQKNDHLGITPDDTFPLKVKIKYHHLVQTCVASKGEIEITALKKVK
jgi:hypothetical protein